MTPMSETTPTTAAALSLREKVSYAPTVPLLWTMIAETADYSEWRTGRRATGLFFSASTLSMKFGWGIGGALAGYLLGFFGYLPNAEQSARAIRGIKLMSTALPGALYVAAGLIMVFYPLTPAITRRMQQELELRRGADSAEDAKDY